ncbi:carboxypeptidase-like regulatory domain-containing protein, partial [Acinetobacter baumannii]
MKSLISLNILLFIFITSAMAHESHLITGKIFESTNSQPLIGAAIKVKGSSKGTITNDTGYFQLKVTQNLPVT